MPHTPIVHFSGHFKFHMPEYNNNPQHPGVAFDPQAAIEDVMAICGCDPARYYEFAFFDTRVRQITYRDGTVATTGDPMLGLALDLAGYFPDVSPSAICARLFAGHIGIGPALKGRVRTAIQSDLRLAVRPPGPRRDEMAAAHFDTTIVVDHLGGDGSRFLAELGAVAELELHFHLNHYTRQDNAGEPDDARLTGDVYGYLRPSHPQSAAALPRELRRRLVVHPRVGERPEIEGPFLTDSPSTPLTRTTDIDGSYDLCRDDGLLALRYLDFVPFLDRHYQTPTSRGLVAGYTVYVDSPAGPVADLGHFVGDHAEMQRTGGLVSFPLPAGLLDREDVWLAVDAVKEATRHPLMIETEWDLTLLGDRGLTLGSGDRTTAVARVYRRNRPAPDVAVRLWTRTSRSPNVAAFTVAGVTSDADGEVRPTIQALDLMNAGQVFDPVTSSTYDRLPMDRYYGNYVYLGIPNPLRRTDPREEVIEIPVRVLHKIDPASIPAQPSFANDVVPLFAYYLRYFPWLHVRRTATGYERVLDLADYDSFSDHAPDVIRRLSLDVDAQDKMPRSRDFPIGGVDVIRRWYATGAHE